MSAHPASAGLREVAMLDYQIAEARRHVERIGALLARARQLTKRLDAIGDAA